MRKFLVIVLSMQLSVYQFSPGQWSCWFCSYQESRKRTLRFEGRKGKQTNSGLQSPSVQVWDWQHHFQLCSMRLLWGAALWRPISLTSLQDSYFPAQSFQSIFLGGKRQKQEFILRNSKDIERVAVGTPWAWGMRYCSSDTSSVRYLDSKQSLCCTIFPFLFLIWQICVMYIVAP